MHEPALAVASDIDKSFPLAMATDDGPSKMADVQQRLGVNVNYASQYRLRLIAAELIYAPRHGYVDFALPDTCATTRPQDSNTLDRPSMTRSSQPT